MHIVIPAGQQGVEKRGEYARFVAAEMAGTYQVQGGAGLRLMLIVPARTVPGAAAGHFRRRQSEQEEVLLARLLRHLDRGAVASADRQGAVHHELHVACSARFVSGGRDLVGDVAGGDQPFGERGAILGQKHHLHPAADRPVAVDREGKIVDELDDQLGKPVGGRGLAGEEERPRRHGEVRVVAQPVVKHDDPQRIEQLPLVLVNPLDLAVEDGIRAYLLAGRRLEPGSEARLGLALGLPEGVAKTSIAGKRRKPAELTEVGNPIGADGLGDRASQGRVCQQQPAPRRDAVGLVVEALGKHFGQVLDRLGAEQLGVNRGHAVGAVRADDRQVGHADLPRGALFDQAHARRAAFIAGKPCANLVEQAPIDFEHDLQVAGQQPLEPAERPFLQRFGQQRMVRVG